MNTFSRRHVLGAGALIGASVLGASAATSAKAATADDTASTSGQGASAGEETKSLAELYADARREGGKLVVYAGGDDASQQAYTVKGFNSSFPDIDLTMVVDYSKYHDVRIDNQLATGTLIPDVVQLQTVQDFERWQQLGVLLPYKPAGFSAVYPAFRDPDGAWLAIQVLAFSFGYNTAAVGSAAPATPLDLVDPRWKGAAASGYPNDDDAVLYLYTLYAQTYGWDFIAKLAAQNVQFARGSYTPNDAIASGKKAIGIATSGSLDASLQTPGTRFVVADGHPFMAWGQRAAILARARHPAAAKLWMNWQVSVATQRQTEFTGWSVRTDVAPPSGLKQIWEYPNANLDGFPRFMADRADAERWRQTFTLYFGEVHGDPTPGWLGLHPGQ